MSEFRYGKTSAETAELNGLMVGTRLDGGPTTGEPTRSIRITAIGESQVLAVTTHNNGEPVDWRESSYSFKCREWRIQPAKSGCNCWRCQTQRNSINRTPWSYTMACCSTCGNKRCPRGTDHDNECTGSNDPGQTGSKYA